MCNLSYQLRWWKHFFLNDHDEYVEFKFSPRGQYIVLLINGRRNPVLHSIQLNVRVTNNCGSEDCSERWTASAIIPQEYLPFNVTRFNAYATHGRTPGEENPAPENIIYESLFPADVDVV